MVVLRLDYIYWMIIDFKVHYVNLKIKAIFAILGF